jgi:hypothetical protein
MGGYVRLLVLNGSPRIGGNTDLLVQSALNAIDRHSHRVDLFRLNDMDIKPCQNCGGCTDTGVCVIEDRMQQIYPALRQADRIILASPIYFFGLSAQTKADCSAATATAFFRSVSVEEHKTLTFLGIDAKGAIRSHPTALQDVYEAVKILTGR